MVALLAASETRALGDTARGHSLISPPLRPLRLLEGDAFNAGVTGHESIESAALHGLPGASPEVVRAVYFGNWQRDVSQFLAPVLADVLGTRGASVGELVFDLLDVIAEARFGWRLNRGRFGVYRWEEHLDNPRGYGVALDARTYQHVPEGRRRREDEPERGGALYYWEEVGGLPRYLLAGRAYVLAQLTEALRTGATPGGYEHFGNALHVVEDFYAHSNFVELAQNLVDGRANPRTGTDRDSGQSLRDALGRWRLTTGVFLTRDTVHSIEKFLIEQIEGPPPGSPPSPLRQRLVRVLVRRLLGGSALTMYDRLVDVWNRTGIPGAVDAALALLGVRSLQEAWGRLVQQPLRHAIATLLRPLLQATANQTGREAFPLPNGRFVIEESHARLSKDDAASVNHQVARRLAIRAVTDFWNEMARTWAARVQPRGSFLEGTRFAPLLDRYMNHPQGSGDWWRPVLAGGGVPVEPGPGPSRLSAPRAPTQAGLPMLRHGSRGPAVADLQRRLNAWLAGRSRPRLAVDGRFGRSTRDAVRAFQGERGLTVDGIVGPRTWHALLGS